MKQNKKDSTLLIRLNKDKKDKFKDKCIDSNTTQTKAIEKFIDSYICEFQSECYIVGELPEEEDKEQ